MGEFFTKSYLSKISFYGLIAILILFNGKIIENDFYFALAIIVVAIIGIYTFIFTIYESYFLSKIGIVRQHVIKPTPGKSMFDSLKKENIKFSNIIELYMMTYDLKNKYNSDSEYGRLLKKNGKDYQFKIFGYGDKEDMQELESNFKKLEVKNSKTHLTKHFNLIKTTQNEYFLWYEPYHKSINGKEILPDGAYLVSLNEDSFLNMRDEYYV
jgi:hypothetical protein